MQRLWKVKKTECFPRSFKVFLENNSAEENLISNYFCSEKEAQVEADRRNQLI